MQKYDGDGGDDNEDFDGDDSDSGVDSYGGMVLMVVMTGNGSWLGLSTSPADVHNMWKDQSQGMCELIWNGGDGGEIKVKVANLKLNNWQT